MLNIDDLDILQSTNLYLDFYNEVKNVPFLESSFLQKSIPKLSKEANRVYPYQVNIPKSTIELLAGDFEPQRVITVTEPIAGPYGEMWFGNSTKGVQLLAGYKNGDSRYVCSQMLGNEDIHGLLAGSTGQGKSVTLSAYIYGMCYQYAPWELNLTLCDPKIVEFKTIAVKNPMPQIVSVAATSDAEYIISVLEDNNREMIKRGSIFTMAGKVFGKEIKNIIDFRKHTGLVMPQIVIIIDEFQTMLKDAAKKSNLIISLLDSFARLGRAAGVHLLLASQEIGSDIPKNMLANIKLRMAMGCFPDISEQVLGNDAAALNMGKRGYMVLNANPAVSPNKQLNETYRIPFAPGDEISAMSSAIIEQGKQYKFENHMNFFDEDALVREDKYEEFLTQFKIDRNKVLLGEPSFVTDDPEKCVKVNYTGTEIETLGIIAGTDPCLSRYVKMFMTNIKLANVKTNMVLCAHPVIENLCHLSEFASKGLYFDEVQYENNRFFNVFTSTVYKRKMLIKADKDIFNDIKQRSDATDKQFDELLGKGSKYDTVLNRERFAYYLYLTATDVQIITGFKLDKLNKADSGAKRLTLAKTCIEMVMLYGVQDVQITVGKLPPVYVWVVGLDSIIGLGRASKPRFVTELSTAMMDSSTVNVRVLTFTTTYTDLSDIVSATRWFIAEGISQSEVSKMKCPDYPDTVGPKLSVIYDSKLQENCCRKFKRMLLNDEIVG